jgi:hypothetical protein
MAISKITNKERDNVRVYGLADRPGLTKEAMQQRFDGLGDLAIDKLNEVIDEVNSLSSASSIKTTYTDADGKSLDVNAVLADLYAKIAALEDKIDNLFVSVEELPETEKEGTVYFVQGEVTVE